MAIISNAVTIADAGAFSASLGSQVLIKTITISSSTSTVQFAHGSSSVVLDSTYPNYLFKYINVHGSHSDGKELVIDYSDSAGSDYDLLHQNTFFRSFHEEDGSNAALAYIDNRDMARSGSRPFISEAVKADNDASISGEMYLFNPSSTTYHKHYMSTSHTYDHDDASANVFVAGYVLTTAAVTALKFEFDQGTIDSGIFKLYGIKDS